MTKVYPSRITGSSGTASDLIAAPADSVEFYKLLSDWLLQFNAPRLLQRLTKLFPARWIAPEDFAT